MIESLVLRPAGNHCRAIALVVLLAALSACGPNHGWQEAMAPVPGAQMAVIGPEAWRPLLEEYCAGRAADLTCRFFSLESLPEGGSDGAAEEAPDQAARIKRLLFRLYREQGLRYALLVGDADIMPVRYMMLDRVTAPAFDVAFYPSDLYYADLARQDGSFDDWNGRRDGFHAGYFGEVHGEHHKDGPINQDGIDYLPEIGVGRWPVGTTEELQAVMAKSLGYAARCQAGAHGGSGQAAVVVTDGWVDCRQRLNDCLALLEPRWSVQRRLYGWPTDQPAAVDSGAVAGLMQGGISLLVHAGHGHPGGWDRSLGVGNLAELDNGEALPIVISAGCSTAAFATLPPYEPYLDVEGNEHAGTNAGQVFSAPPPPPACLQPAHLDAGSLGEQLVLHPRGGAIAYIGCNTGSQPCALTLVEGFVSAAADQPAGTIGECWSAALRHYWKAERLAELRPDEGWYPPSVFFQGMKFMLFGDPSLPLPGPVSPAAADD